MKEGNYTNFDELPLFLNAETLAKLLGVSVSSSCELMHEKNFPAKKYFYDKQLQYADKIIAENKLKKKLDKMKSGQAKGTA